MYTCDGTYASQCNLLYILLIHSITLFANRLRHPHLIQLMGYCTTPPSLIMPFMERRSLFYCLHEMHGAVCAVNVPLIFSVVGFCSVDHWFCLYHLFHSLVLTTCVFMNMKLALMCCTHVTTFFPPEQVSTHMGGEDESAAWLSLWSGIPPLFESPLCAP